MQGRLLDVTPPWFTSGVPHDERLDAVDRLEKLDRLEKVNGPQNAADWDDLGLLIGDATTAARALPKGRRLRRLKVRRSRRFRVAPPTDGSWPRLGPRRSITIVASPAFAELAENQMSLIKALDTWENANRRYWHAIPSTRDTLRDALWNAWQDLLWAILHLSCSVAMLQGWCEPAEQGFPDGGLNRQQRRKLRGWLRGVSVVERRRAELSVVSDPPGHLVAISPNRPNGPPLHRVAIFHDDVMAAAA